MDYFDRPPQAAASDCAPEASMDRKVVRNLLPRVDFS
jgi:hypothetical protein